MSPLDVSIHPVHRAWQLIQPHVRRTPVIELPIGSLGLVNPLAVKLEALQYSGSFKGRGAFHKLLSIEPLRPICCCKTR